MKMKCLCIIFLLLGLNLTFAQEQKWYKGNTHAHTNQSDGDSSVEDVVDWYNKHGYNFLAITDHNLTVPADSFVAKYRLRDDFMLITSNELSTGYFHTTALGIYVPLSFEDIRKQLDGEVVNTSSQDLIKSVVYVQQKHIDGILKLGGLPIINHPNFGSGINERDVLQLKDIHHFELYNAHPECANWGKSGHFSTESMWDFLLSSGMKMYGIGSDDSHYFKQWGTNYANPGRSWIMVNAIDLTQKNIVAAIRDGQYYVSTGVEVKSYLQSGNKLSVEVDLSKTDNNIKSGLGDFKSKKYGEEGCRIDIVSLNGDVVFSAKKNSLVYDLGDFNQYVRVRIAFCVKIAGQYRTYYAWMQPVFKSV